MKQGFFTSTVALFALLVMLASCGSSRRTTDKRYPYPGSPYPYPDGRNPRDYPYPDGYPNDRYPDYGKTRYPQNLPPGQAKKIYGQKSAKVFAPGQRKKQGGYYPLIIYRRPGMVIGRANDGRPFYRNEDDFYYWQGNDDRFYLDQRYLDRVNYSEEEFEAWKSRGKGYNEAAKNSKKYDDDHGNGKPGKGHGNGKAKGRNK